MNAFLSPTTPADALPVSVQHDSAAVGERRQPESLDVGAVRQDQIRSGRIRYAVRFICWTLRHGSTKHVRWVLAFEGYTWD